MRHWRSESFQRASGVPMRPSRSTGKRAGPPSAGRLPSCVRTSKRPACRRQASATQRDAEMPATRSNVDPFERCTIQLTIDYITKLVLSWRVKIDLQRRAGLPCSRTLEKASSRQSPFHSRNFLPRNMLQTFPVSPFPAALSQKQGGRGSWPALSAVEGSYQFQFTATGLKTGHYMETNRPASEGGLYIRIPCLLATRHSSLPFAVRLTLAVRANCRPHLKRIEWVRPRESPRFHSGRAWRLLPGRAAGRVQV